MECIQHRSKEVQKTNTYDSHPCVIDLVALSRNELKDILCASQFPCHPKNVRRTLGVMISSGFTVSHCGVIVN